jgi:hypothetical protein
LPIRDRPIFLQQAILLLFVHKSKSMFLIKTSSPQ